MIMRTMRFITIAMVLSFSLATLSCSSSPSEDQMRQLNDLKAEVASLEQQIGARDKEKSALEKEVADKNTRLQHCMADKEAVTKGTLK